MFPTKTLKSFLKKLITALLSVSVLISCHKEQPTPPDTTGDYCGLASVSNQFNQLMRSYKYNLDHKIQKIITFDTANGNIEYYTEYNYGTSQIITTYFYADGSPGHAQYYLLNELGYPEKKIVSTSFRNDTAYFEYDHDGYLIKSISMHGSGGYDTLHYNYSEGKRTIIISPGGVPSFDTIKYEYYNFTIPHNTLALLNYDDNYSIDPAENELFLGKNTDLAVKSKTVRYNNDPNHIVHYEYFYEFDTDSILTKIKGTLGYLNSYTLYSYELNVSVECK